MNRTAIGPYQVVRLLGRGGMAEVHLAIAHGASGFEREVAIKTVATFPADEALERALIREAVIGGALHHANLVSVLGLGTSDGGYYVVLEYVDRGDLARHVKGPLHESLVLFLVGEVAAGLAHLHAARDKRGLPLAIVHRDVGPANVLVSSTGDVKLADFGVAKATALADRTAAGTRKGRYSYMAPEQLAGEPVTAAADQFGLGVMLVELLTGKRPFAGETPWAVLDSIRASAPLLAELLPDVRAVALKALAVDPRDRFAGVDDLRAILAVIARTRAPAGREELAAFLRGT